MDNLSPEQRSHAMRRVHSKNTSPEMTLRRELHRRGLRYSLHRKDLPGKPDLVFRKYRAVIFVHGCFWHRHPDCAKGNSTPASRLNYWAPKFKRTVDRDAHNRETLAQMGWEVITVWECELKDLDSVAERVLLRLQGRQNN